MPILTQPSSYFEQLEGWNVDIEFHISKSMPISEVSGDTATVS